MIDSDKTVYGKISKRPIKQSVFFKLTLKASGVGGLGGGVGGQVLAHESKPYARDFLVHIVCVLNAILLKNYK